MAIRATSNPCLPPAALYEYYTTARRRVFWAIAEGNSDIIDKRLYQSGGRLTMSKQDLWGVYRVACSRAFTSRTIRSACRAAGLYPVDPLQPESRIPRLLTPTI